MPIEYWTPPITERGPDKFVMPDGEHYEIRRDGDIEAAHLTISGGTVLAEHWEEFDRMAREYLGLPAPYKRRRTTVKDAK